MARVNIPGTKTDWLVIRGWINNMFIELYTAKDAEKKGRLSVIEGSNPIVFDTPFPDGTDYEVLRNCFDNAGTVEYSISNKTETGFTINAASSGTFIYQTITF